MGGFGVVAEGVLGVMEQRKEEVEEEGLGGEWRVGEVGRTSVETECQGAMFSPPAFPWLQGNSGE